MVLGKYLGCFSVVLGWFSGGFGVVYLASFRVCFWVVFGFGVPLLGWFWSGLGLRSFLFGTFAHAFFDFKNHRNKTKRAESQ